MQITLPVSNRTLEIPVVSHTQGKELAASHRKIRTLLIAEEDAEKVGDLIDNMNQITDDIIKPLVEGFEELPHRDVLLLRRVTIDYNMGEPIAAIKNLLATGDGAPTSSEQTIVPTAKKSKGAKS